MRFFRGITASAITLGISLSLLACGTKTVENANQTNQTSEVTVFAAKSLTRAFEQIDREVFAPNHPNVAVKFSFDGSNTLIKQISQGAPANILATADEKNMALAIKQDLVQDAQPFVANILTLIVPAGNPAGITGLDQSLKGKKLVVCAPGVPCGNATLTLSRNLGIKLNPVSEEKNVGDVRAKVEMGEADAGLVYVTDAKSGGKKVQEIPLPGSEKVVNRYPIAIVKDSKQHKPAQAFIAAVLSEAGQKILADYGFKPAGFNSR